MRNHVEIIWDQPRIIFLYLKDYIDLTRTVSIVMSLEGVIAVAAMSTFEVPARTCTLTLGVASAALRRQLFAPTWFFRKRDPGQNRRGTEATPRQLQFHSLASKDVLNLMSERKKS